MDYGDSIKRLEFGFEHVWMHDIFFNFADGLFARVARKEKPLTPSFGCFLRLVGPDSSGHEVGALRVVDLKNDFVVGILVDDVFELRTDLI